MAGWRRQVCSKRGIEKPVPEFPWRNKRKGTWRSECKPWRDQGQPVDGAVAFEQLRVEAKAAVQIP